MNYKLFDIKIKHDNIEYNVNYLSNNVCVIDTYKLNTNKLKWELIDYLETTVPELFKSRSRQSVFNEIKAHNILYKLHIKRLSTKDTDLEFEQDLLHRFAYWFISLFKE